MTIRKVACVFGNFDEDSDFVLEPATEGDEKLFDTFHIVREDFDDFIKTGETGKYLLNPFWLEYILDLYFQEYYGELADELMDTKLNIHRLVENQAMRTISEEENETRR